MSKSNVVLPVYQNVRMGYLKVDRENVRIMICDCCWFGGEGEDFSGRRLAEYLHLDVTREFMVYFVLS